MAVLVTLKANSGPLTVNLDSATTPSTVFIGAEPVERMYLGATLVTDIGN